MERFDHGDFVINHWVSRLRYLMALSSAAMHLQEAAEEATNLGLHPDNADTCYQDYKHMVILQEAFIETLWKNISKG